MNIFGTVNFCDLPFVFALMAYGLDPVTAYRKTFFPLALVKLSGTRSFFQEKSTARTSLLVLDIWEIRTHLGHRWLPIRIYR